MKQTNTLSALLCCFLLFVIKITHGQDTFSFIATDPNTGIIVSAGGSCLDGHVAEGGARIVSDIVPGIGALHTQSFYIPGNQAKGAKLLRESNLDSKAIIDSLIKSDIGRTPSLRQYACLIIGNRKSTSAYTGENCYEYAGQFIDKNIVIAGNILKDESVISKIYKSYEKALEKGNWIGDASIKALESVAFPGADRRCLSQNISCRSAFLRIARPTDSEDNLLLDLVVEFPEDKTDPIKTLSLKYSQWKNKNKSVINSN